MIGRRQFLGVSAAGAAVVVGFDPSGRGWVTEAAAAGRPSFAAAPALDGELLLDAVSRQAVTTDLGNIVRRAPRAVLRPASVADIAKMIRFCRAHGIAVAPRGQAHTTYGQGLSAGLLIEMRHLDRVHALGPRTAEVDAGIRWMDLTEAAYARSPRLTPPVLTGYTGLSVGGTLSVGGIGGLVGGLHTGLQVDHVRALEVVTGTGAVERCSRHRRSDLFEAVLGGLGQCGVITKAVVDLVPAREETRTYAFGYTGTAAFFRDFRTLVERPGIDHIYAEFVAPGTAPTYTIHATVFHDAGAPPDDGRIAAGLSAEPEIADAGYLDYAFSIDRAIDALRETERWDEYVKPWFDVWLPGSTVEDFFHDLMPRLTPRDIGAFGAGLIYPQRRAHTTRPFPRLPRRDGSPWAFVVDINTVSPAPGPDPAFAEEMLARNVRLFARTRERFGGTLYPIGSVPFTPGDWRAHYGDRWPAFRAAKRRYDPSAILTPGAGVFGG
ncbi:FAD-binding protein [Streptomyces zingiberis]|uniref:FAD-binding protein n=1 Tax=Streptomyces zingiberis TaxID=2053010 RepID=A0ABX1BN00_9ACTN|nr:FAD-binding protein [Streptomyces zingiberis]NJP99114.1 FAD-binding protein [Streptomyces zingiberis]